MDRDDQDEISVFVNLEGKLVIETYARRKIISGYEVLPICERFKVNNVCSLTAEQKEQLYIEYTRIESYGARYLQRM